MSATALQTTGFVSGAIGTVGVLAATVMDVWCTEDQQEHRPTYSHHYKSLWKDCEVSQTGLPECQPLNSYLSYSRILQAIRALMIVAILVGVIAVFIGFFCLKCLNMRSMDLFTKGKLVLSAGILFIIAGIFDISGSSVYADQIVPSFMMQYPTQYNQKQGEKGGVHCGNGMGTGTGMGGLDSFASRYTFGPALYVAWVGGALLILGGILKCIAFNTMQTNTDTRESYFYTAQRSGTNEDCRLQRMRGEQQQI
ncbi:claudin-18-like [Carassius auratus]|uniref:Claudin-18-like n=1 Tax=Carassius auratus TaxID=7957 RepID=A0A6P6JTP7_CARAU|nr:claudin-18-like [Carassius auratus]XP_052403653.1 claudin-18-like [Carassius gibelio]